MLQLSRYVNSSPGLVGYSNATTFERGKFFPVLLMFIGQEIGLVIPDTGYGGNDDDNGNRAQRTRNRAQF